jgi:hypothetical protein
MFTLLRRLFFIVFFILVFSSPSYAARLGIMNSEGDGTPGDVYAYKVVWPNGTISITNGVLTFTEVGGGGLDNVVEDVTPQLGGDLDLNSNNIDFPTTPNVSDCLDEDNMASDSATKLSTQQSIKAYADTKLANVVEDTTPEFAYLDMTSRTSAPGTPIDGAIYKADNDTWDPITYAGVVDYWVMYDGVSYIGLWDDDGNFLISTIQAAGNVIADADGIVLTAAQMMSTIVMTGAGDVDIPADQCDSATGKWLIVKSTAAHLNSLTSNDASDLFVLSDGTELDAQDELDLAGAAGSQVTVQCLATNKWYVIGEIGTAVDGDVP